MATNFEFYKDKILNEFIKEYQMHCFALAMEIVTGVEFHIGCECGKCSSCEKIVFEWLYAEHIEQPKLTKRERAFCEAVKRGHIVRNKDGKVFYSADSLEPWKRSEGIWSMNYCIELGAVGLSFDCVKWEDDYPWRVEDLLKLEVIEECSTLET